MPALAWSVAVTAASLYEVALPLAAPFRLSGGTMRERRSLLVALEDGEGNVGWGESAPFEAPFYSSETIASARAVLRDVLLPRIVGRRISDPAELATVLAEGIRGNPMARAGVETAWWDLVAARTGRPLAELVTARLRELGVAPQWCERLPQVACGIALGIPDPPDLDALAREVERAVARGYRRVKLKIRPGWDLEPVRSARGVLGGRDAVPLTVDANGAYRLDRDAAVLEALDALELLYIEQPLEAESLFDLVELSGRLRTPVCVDESLTSDDVGRQLIAHHGPSVWNLKVQRVGGLEEACRLYARGVAAGIRLWVGTMPETGLGAQAALALAAHTGCQYPSDLEPSERWYGTGTDVVRLEMGTDGTMPVPTERPAVNLAGAALIARLASPEAEG